MSSNNSDYNKPRQNLVNLLPEVYRSDTNRALFENLFNRFLTKQETTKVAGYIGDGNPNAIVKRQIKEPTVHRQGYQLQPILYDKIGSVEWMSSWHDLLNEAERLGIDPERMQEWLNLVVFNWAPPIDIDKLIHYSDYYWYDTENPNSRPQYITIRSRCSTATALANFYQNIVDEFGATIPTDRALPIDGVIPQYSIVSINAGLNQVIVQGNVVGELSVGQHFAVSGTVLNNDTYRVAATPTYNSGSGQSIIVVETGTLAANELGIGTLTLRRFDKLVVAGDFTRLFEPGFVFFYKNSTNTDLEITFWTVVESSFDSDNNETIIKINAIFTDGNVDGVISQEEKLAIAQSGRECQCAGSVGWDVYQWDDNPIDPLWSGAHDLLITGMSNSGPPPAVGSPITFTDGELWWDQNSDRLYQFSLNTIDWALISNSFSSIVNDTVGQGYWDYSPGCGVSSVISAADQWIEQNKWLHKSDVPNFTLAKQAQIPIIEYDWDLELNEWTYTTHSWKYRKDTFTLWNEVEPDPQLIELIPLENWTQDGEEIVLDSSYGDLTDYFTPGKQFMADGVLQILVVDYSVYKAPTAGQPRETRIKLTINVTGSGLVPASVGSPYVPSTTPFHPIKTSIGDTWLGYNTHWLFVGEETTVPVVHQPENDLIPIAILAPITVLGDYEYKSSSYAMDVTILTPTTTNIEFPTALRTRALVGFNDVRVYKNNVREYGTYDELDGDGNGFVTEIQFLPGYVPDQFDNVRIEVGEAAQSDIGWASIPVRVHENDLEFSIQGTTDVSLIKYRKEEQVKVGINQYPLFDIYNVDGTPAYKANPIFSYQTDPDASVNSLIGQRLATDSSSTDYVFQQHLVDPDGTMYAYRDYVSSVENIFVNTTTQEVFFWTGLTWSNKVAVGAYYLPAFVGEEEPTLSIDGTYWYDTLSGILKKLNSGNWETVEALYADNDTTLQTIWKKGLNDETYIPEKRDWDKRTLAEYNQEKDVYVTEQIQQLTAAGMPLSQATAEANASWLDEQSNHLSPTGEWIGEWEIPDPLYYNVSHKNRQALSYRELLTHFNTIIQSQPKIPGFNGPLESMFHLIPTNEVNYGLGGKIHEYNYGFDTFLSTLFINTVSPRALFEFAQSQYDVLLNNLKEALRRNAVDLLTDTSSSAQADIGAYVTQFVISEHELNDNFALLYGDSTTFTEVDGPNDTGIRNWIATLPYLAMLEKRQPTITFDGDRDINQITHHDGHRAEYTFSPTTVEGIIRTLLLTPDERTRFPGPTDPALDTFGHMSTSLPPNNTTEFEAEFVTSILSRAGVYWYHVVGTERTLYRLNVASIGVVAPSVALADGTLWLDMTPGSEVLRIKQGNTWAIVDGLSPGTSPIRLHNGTDPSDMTTATVSAWQELDLNVLLRNVVFEVENKLYENVPDFPRLKYDIQALTSEYPQLYEQLLESYFLSYANSNEIFAPYANDAYTAADPFTWNYRYSSPGSSFQIIDADSTDNFFKVEGNQTATFVTNSHFHIKNSGVNDGYWKVSSSSWDGTHTTIYVVDRAVTDSLLGTIYTGILPSAWDPVLRPYNLNDGSESGGDWRDLYQKLYNTPYPHLEPWALQGYVEKPNWWDEEYLNDDPAKWGDRRWKYKHGFEIVGVDATGDYFDIVGDFSELFVPGFEFAIANSPSVHDGDWQVDYTVYNPTTNRLRIYVDTGVKEVTVNVVSGYIAGKDGGVMVGYGMWENIRTGVVPPSRPLPTDENGVPVTGLPEFNYFSVNISNDTIVSGGTYDPDDVFPPYWNYVAYFGTPSSFDSPIRSVYSSFTEITSPGAAYAFGDAGPTEWEWRNSLQFLYDQLAIAFQIDPVRFTYLTFGPEFYVVGGLLINKRTNQVLSHTNTVFHGDIVNNAPIQFDGTNQWYVNFARHSGIDLSMSDFRSQWTLWTTPMTYQFASFIDTPSLSVNHRNICISDFDYRVTAKRSPGVEDYWLDSFQAAILSIPPKIARYDNDYDWEIELRTKSPVGKPIKYYGVRNYQFYADPTTDICSLYTWDVVGASSAQNTLSIRGNQTHIFTTGRSFTVSGSTANNGAYTTMSSAFNAISNETIVSVNEDIVSFVADGRISAEYRTLPWTTGDRVVLSTRETLPVPLQGDNTNGVYEYFVVVINSTQFKLARTQSAALAGNGIDITSVGIGDHFVGQIATTFHTSNTPTNWRHYVVDTTTLLEFTPPYDVRGLQSVINIIDGYETYTKEQGWRINSTGVLKDINNSSRFVGWQVEVERFIDYTHNLRNTQRKVGQKYEATIDEITDVWTFTEQSGAQFITGDPVAVYVSGNVFPVPLARGLRYYMIRDSISQFRLAATKADAEAGIAIDITSTAGVGQIYITEAANLRKKLPTFEINPFRNGIWFRPEHGIVSNVVSGPADDIFNTQLLLDQYGRSIGSNHIKVFREDKETQISISDGILNDVELTSVFNDPYNLIHLAAVHLFLDTYEHVMIFNNDTTEGQLLYDPFLGLNVTKFELLFNRGVEFTQRPNVGGQYLSTVFNQGADLKRNFEASVEDLRLLNDTYQVIEANPLVQFSRKSLGYEGSQDYLDNININAKSQFVFWRGQIQNKGSVNSVKAFVNSRRFIDAKVDEFWAVKIAEFGSAQEKEYISMWLSTSDNLTNDLRLHFLLDDSTVIDDTTYTPILLSDEGRWYDQPDQLEKLRDNGGTLYFELKPTTKFVVDPQVGSPIASRIRHNTMSDFVSITTSLYENGYSSNHLSPSATLNIDPYIPGTDGIRIFGDGRQLVVGVDYNEVPAIGLTSTSIELIGSPLPSVVDVVHKTSTLVEGEHFARINSNIVEFTYPDVLVNGVTIWGWNADEDSLSPAKIIDKKSETVVSPVQLWDPARGHHYYNGIHVVDLQNGVDPAVYNNTPRGEFDNAWNVNEVGTTWIDTSDIGYVPYYDDKVFTKTDDRVRLWGTLADWADLKIRTWVESDVPPEEWNTLAEQEEGNASLPDSTRKSGRAYMSLFEKDGGSPANWVLLKDKREFFDVAVDGTGPGTNTFTLSTIPAGQTVNVYVNGQIRSSGVVVSPMGEVTVTNLNLVDRVCVELPVPTDEDYIANEIVAGNLLQEYEYTTVKYFDALGQERTKYYFWVVDKTTRGNKTMPPSEAQDLLVEIPVPYMFFQGVEDSLQTTFGAVPVTLPVRFTKAVVHGLRGIVGDDLRYVLRWTRDFTLRDSLDDGSSALQKKNLHQQWELIRRDQPSHIPRWLWDKVTEAIVGHKLTDSSARVPSYERELYDEENGTDTQFGLRDGQAIADGTLALATILADLNNPNNDFAPVDINVFFDTYNFDTPEAIEEAMNVIYNTFVFSHVNRMFFDVLLDGLSMAGKYEDIFKTSMVALHGIRPLQVGGAFDD